MLKKTERTGIRKKSGALGSRRTVSCSFLRAEQAEGCHGGLGRMARHRQAYLDLDTSTSSSSSSSSILFYSIPDAVSRCLSLSLSSSLAVLPRLLGGWRCSWQS